MNSEAFHVRLLIHVKVWTLNLDFEAVSCQPGTWPHDCKDGGVVGWRVVFQDVIRPTTTKESSIKYFLEMGGKKAKKGVPTSLGLAVLFHASRQPPAVPLGEIDGEQESVTTAVQ
jgi:hypothetical protein